MTSGSRRLGASTMTDSAEVVTSLARSLSETQRYTERH